ncbi:complement factor H-related protein 2-like isoform 1-T1 [Molossus nigricans]
MLLLVSALLSGWVSWAHGQEVTCDPPRFANSHYTPDRTSYGLGHVITYGCKSGFYPPPRGNTAKCTPVGWDPPPRCSFKPCEYPEVKHGRLYREDSYRPYFPARVGQWFYYSCDDNYSTPSQQTWGHITCTQQGWSPEVPCLRKCVFNYLENGRSPASPQTHLQGASVLVNCHPGFSLQDQQSTMNCTESGWSPLPNCILVDSKGQCGPPPSIDNGDTTTFPSKVYAPGSSVEYQCQSYYELQGDRRITCREGKWSEPPKCLEPCVLSEEIMEKHSIELQWSYEKKIYSKTNDVVEFRCRRGYRKATPETKFRVQCREGVLAYPTCVKR